MKNKIVFALIGLALLVPIVLVVLKSNNDDSVTDSNDPQNIDSVEDDVITLSEQILTSIPEPTSPPYENCTWEPYYSEKLGVGMQTMSCAGFSGFQTKDNNIVNVRDDGVLIKAIEVYPKSSENFVTTEINQRFVQTLEDPAKSGCEVVEGGIPPRNEKIKRYTITPQGEYAEEVKEAGSKSPGVAGCGEYGAKDAVTFFEYHGEENENKYLFVWVGQGQPMFDEQSIIIKEIQ